MAIDNCHHSFEALAEKVLPAYLDQMQERMKSPLLMKEFSKFGIGKKTILRILNLEADFSGCYVLIDSGDPIYVGISRGVINRLIQHVKGKTHFDASLAYRIARSHFNHNLSRDQAMKHSDFNKEFQKAKRYLSKVHVAFIPIINDMELHLFEAYCAMQLDTSKWNTFATH